MNSVIENLDRVHALCTHIEQKVLDLEGRHHSLRELRSAIQDSIENLINLIGNRSAFTKEAALRLRALSFGVLDGKVSGRDNFRPLYRQLGKISDILFSEYFSSYEAKNSSVDISSRLEALVSQAGHNTILVYSLGGMNFGIRGKILLCKKNINLNVAKKIRFRKKIIECFPSSPLMFSEKKNHVQDILIVAKGDTSVGLWMDRVVGLHRIKDISFEIGGAEHSSLPRINRFVRGRYSYRGRTIYLLDI